MYKEEQFNTLQWNEDMIPLIFFCLGDYEFLIRKNLVLIMNATSLGKDNETVLGKIQNVHNFYLGFHNYNKKDKFQSL